MKSTMQFQPGTPSIIGAFEKQRWSGPKANHAELVEEATFDATAYILQLPARETQRIKDCDGSSDDIGQRHVDHDGPCSVYIEQAIRDFFKVENLADVTPALLQKARAWLRSLPEKHYTVRLRLTNFVDVTVKSRHPSEVATAATSKIATTPQGKSAHQMAFVSMRQTT
jgi:hypothetical protein